MLDRREYVLDEGSRDETAPNDAADTRALQTYVNRETSLSAPVSGDDTTNYAELFARLQKLIDNATQTIRELRRENADLSGRVSQLDAYIHMRAEVVDNEEQLQKSAARLEELLTLQEAAAASVAPPAPPTPLRVFEPPRESTFAMRNGHAAAHEAASYMPPPPIEPAMSTFSAPAPRPPIEHADNEAATDAPPVVRDAPACVPPVMPEAITREATPYVPLTVDETATVPFPSAPLAPSAPRALELVVPAETAPDPPLVSAPSVAVATPAPIPVRRPTPAPASGNEKVAGTYTLMVYPFTRFSDLGQFQSVLQDLVGIHDVQVRRFARGTLEMRLGYDGVTPLPRALHNLSVRIENVEEEEPYRLQVRLDLNHAC